MCPMVSYGGGYTIALDRPHFLLQLKTGAGQKMGGDPFFWHGQLLKLYFLWKIPLNLI